MSASRSNNALLRLAAGLSTIVAALLLVAAVYYYFVPALIGSQEGVFGCGSAGNPPTDGFAKGACQGTSAVILYRVVALAVAGLAVGILGYVGFGPIGGGRQLSHDEDDEDLEDEPEFGASLRVRESAASRPAVSAAKGGNARPKVGNRPRVGGVGADSKSGEARFVDEAGERSTAKSDRGGPSNSGLFEDDHQG